MKRLVICLIFLALIPIAFADWFYDSQNIVASINIHGNAEVVPKKPSGYIDTAAVNMTFFPKQSETQEILKIYTSPTAELTADSLKFTYKRPEEKIDFRVEADVKTINAFPEINQKIKFPVEKLPENVRIYTKPSETIDSGNEAIIRTASELVRGEDDLYAAVFKLAEWTKSDVNYNLSTLSASVTQKASDVLKSRQGVCSDISSLFIALSRAVGIPARFVSGIAYTDSPLFPENWGAHGWAEVYFPNYGWVPFDPTYGEYGWVDPTHIKFKDSVDSDEPSTYYSWVGRDADLRTGKLDIKAELKEKIGYYRTPLNLDVSVLKKSAGFHSYNLLTATIDNPNGFYYATDLRLSKPKEVIIEGDEPKSILLLPREKKKVFWILRLDGDLDSRYSYRFPLIVSTTDNISSETGFAASAREEDVSIQEVEQIAKLLEEEKEKKYSGNVLLECKIPKIEFYEYEDVEVYCDAKNTGNVFLENADACFEGVCKKLSLGIAQTKNVTFQINNSLAGLKELPVTLRNALVSKASYVSFRLDDAPKIEIEDLEFPINVSYDENFSVSFVIAKKSQSSPKNVEVVFAQNGFEKKWNIEELKEDRKFVLDFIGKDLKYGKNSYRINVDYLDGLKKQYKANKEFSVELANVTLWQRFLLWVNSLI